jgi:hypothetical protein
LGSLNLGHPFYFLRPGRRTPSRFNLAHPSGSARPTFDAGSVDP